MATVINKHCNCNYQMEAIEYQMLKEKVYRPIWMLAIRYLKTK